MDWWRSGPRGSRDAALTHILVHSLQGLTKQFGLTKKFTAVNGLSLKMQSGKVFALLGHNGAGKTTAIRVRSVPTVVPPPPARVPMRVARS